MDPPKYFEQIELFLTFELTLRSSKSDKNWLRYGPKCARTCKVIENFQRFTHLLGKLLRGALPSAKSWIPHCESMFRMVFVLVAFVAFVAPAGARIGHVSSEVGEHA